MTPTPWHEQITYYRRRADEYDATSYRDLAKASARIAALAGQLCPTGDLLEIARGTGIWTGPLAEHARTVTAIDAAPEMIALARRRVTGRKVTFVAADVLRWTPPRRFDTIFFAFWLSHVPHRSSAGSGRWSAVRWPATAACCSSTISRPPRSPRLIRRVLRKLLPARRHAPYA